MTRLRLALAGLLVLLILAAGGCAAPTLPELPELPRLPEAPRLPGLPTLIPRLSELPTLVPPLPGLPTLAPTRTPAPALPTLTRIAVKPYRAITATAPPPTATPAPPTATVRPPRVTSTPIPPTITPSPPTATHTPLPQATSIPRPTATPPRLDEYPAAVAALLTATRGDVEALRETLIGWGALPAGFGEVRTADLDGDGRAEIVVPLVGPQEPELLERQGLVVVLRGDEKGYTVAWQGERPLGAAEPGPATLFTVEDLTGDGRPEVAYTSVTCGAHTCFTSVNVLAWREGSLVSITAGEISMPSADWVQFVDEDGDGTQELVIHGGVIGSVGAGPPRTRTDVYRWDGVAYALAETRLDPTRFLYWTVIDANDALLRGEVEEAIRLYRQVREDPSLETWMDTAERAELGAFAGYRLVVAHALLGQDDQVRFWAEELEREQPENPYTVAARRFWEVYRLTENVGVACQVVTAFAEDNPEMVDVLAKYGYATPPFGVQDVCPFPVGTPSP